MNKKWIAVAGMMVATFAVSTSVFAGAKGKSPLMTVHNRL